MAETCTEAVREQIKKEIQASSNYLAAGSHFLKSNINRPGFAKFFIGAAKEEREHSMHLMEYLLNRGITNVHSLIKVPVPENQFLKPATAVDALRAALVLEAAVTDSIKNVIKVCENVSARNPGTNENDYHVRYKFSDFN